MSSEGSSKKGDSQAGKIVAAVILLVVVGLGVIAFFTQREPTSGDAVETPSGVSETTTSPGVEATTPTTSSAGTTPPSAEATAPVATPAPVETATTPVPALLSGTPLDAMPSLGESKTYAAVIHAKNLYTTPEGQVVMSLDVMVPTSDGSTGSVLRQFVTLSTFDAVEVGTNVKVTIRISENNNLVLERLAL